MLMVGWGLTALSAQIGYIMPQTYVEDVINRCKVHGV